MKAFFQDGGRVRVPPERRFSVNRRQTLGVLLPLRRRVVAGWAKSLLLCAGLCAGCAKEPVYEGHPLSYWIEAARWDDAEVRVKSLDVFEKMGAAAAPALPVIVDRIAFEKNWRVKQMGAAAMVGIGKPAVPAARDMLRDSRGFVRMFGAQILGDIGAPAARCGPALRDRLKDKDREVRAAAALALGKLGEAAKDAGTVTALAEAFGDSYFAVRCNAAESLARLGGAAKPALAAIVGALGDTYPTVRQQCAAILVALGAEAFPALERGLANTNEAIRMSAVQVLVQVGKPAIAPLIRALDNPNRDVRLMSMGVLGDFGPAASNAVPILVRTLTGTESDLRALASSALLRIGPASVSALAGLLRAPDRDTRIAGIRLLASFGPTAGDAAPALETLAKGEDQVLGQEAARALRSVRPP